MSAHPRELVLGGVAYSPKEVAERLAQLEYGTLAEYVRELAERLETGSVADGKLGRKKLSAALHVTEGALRIVHRCLGIVAHICEPYMRGNP